jgi:hypothetical protein
MPSVASIIWSMVPYVGIAVLLYIILRRSNVFISVPRDRHGRLPAVLDSRGRPLEVSVLAEQANPAYEVRQYHDDERNGPFLWVSLYLPTPVEFSVDVTVVKDSLLIRLLSWRVRSGHDDFDGRYTIRSMGSQGAVRAMLESEACRAAIERLFALGFTGLRSDGKGLDAIGRPCLLDGQIDSSVIEATVEHLRTIADSSQSPETTAQHSSPVREPLATIFIIFIPIVIGFVLAHFATGRFQRVEGASNIMGLAFPIALVPAALFALYLWTRMRRLQYGRIAMILASAVAILMTWAGSTFGIVALNAVLDRGQPTVHIQRLVDFGIADRDRPYVDVVPWYDDAENAQRLWITRSEHDLLASIIFDFPFDSGIEVEIGSKPGYFGYEWIESYHLLVRER